MAAESDRAYQGGPLERTFYQEAFLTPEEGGLDADVVKLPNQYNSRLDWFAVDLEGEHSAMDGGILEEHTEYVVYAIHRVWILTLFFSLHLHGFSYGVIEGFSFSKLTSFFIAL